MKDNPLISIIVPLYNSEKYVRSLVDNVFLSKNKEKIEVVLIDDGSKDQTSFICEDIIRNNPLVNYYRKENGGIASARNYGIEASKGKYIFFHDHDDFVDIDTLDFAIDTLLTSNYDLFIFNSNRVEDKKEYPALKLNDLYIKKYGNHANCDDLLNKVCHHKNNHKIANRLGYIWSMIISRDFVCSNNLRFKKSVNYEDDLTFCINLFSKKPNTILSNKVIYHWMMNSSSTSHSSKYDQSYFDKILVLENDLKTILQEQSKYDDLINNVLWGFYYNFFVFYCERYSFSTYKQFKEIINKEKIRDRVLLFKRREFVIKQKIVIVLVWLKCYKTIYSLFKRRSQE